MGECWTGNSIERENNGKIWQYLRYLSAIYLSDMANAKATLPNAKVTLPNAVTILPNTMAIFPSHLLMPFLHKIYDWNATCLINYGTKW